MNNKLIEDAVARTRAAVEKAKARGEKTLLFSTLYCSWDFDLTPDEKVEMKKRFADEGWTLAGEYVDEGQKSIEKSVLRF